MDRDNSKYVAPEQGSGAAPLGVAVSVACPQCDLLHESSAPRGAGRRAPVLAVTVSSEKSQPALGPGALTPASLETSICAP